MLLVATLWATALSAQTDRSMKQELTLITIEEHFANPRIAEADARWRPKTELTDEQRDVMAFFASRMNLTEQLGDLSEKRIPHMDSQGIRMQILSYTSLIGDYVPAEEAVKIACEANDLLAQRIKEHPDRFRAMATLPLADPEAAVKELERCVKELGFVGVLSMDSTRAIGSTNRSSCPSSRRLPNWTCLSICIPPSSIRRCSSWCTCRPPIPP